MSKIIERQRKATWEKQLITVFETEPFSLAVLGNIAAVIKPDLMKIGFRDFPVLTLTGKPGSGKTTIARACIGSNAKEYSFTDKVSTVKKELADTPDGYILLDDFAAFASQAAREKARTFLDEVARLSYSGVMPFMIITVEEKALTQITPSCRERLLEIPVDDVLKNDRLCSILEYLTDNKEKLDDIVIEFAEWYSSRKYHYTDALKSIRNQYKGKIPEALACLLCVMYQCVYFVTMQQRSIRLLFQKTRSLITISSYGINGQSAQ